MAYLRTEWLALLNLLQRFLVAHGASAFATGIHIVMSAWIAVSVLNLSSLSIGWVQAAGLIPNIFLMLLAGAWADRRDPAKVLALALSLHSVCFFSLAVLIKTDALSLHGLLLYSLFVGVGNAFCQPAREKLVSEIDRHSIQARVSLLSITQFSLQSAGIVLAGLADSIGIFEIVLLQGVASLVSLGVALTLCNKTNIPQEDCTSSSILDEIKAAVQLVRSNLALKQLMLLIAFNGYMHMGVFIVLLPIMATKIYHFSSVQYGSLQLLFVVGMITAHFSLLKKDTIEFPGHGALFCLLYTAVIGFALSKFPTEFGFYALVFCWGLVAGNSAGRCRLVLQALVEKDMKGRAISMYQMCLFGAAPFGALVTGVVIDYLSIQEILDFMSVSSIALFAVFLFSRSLWSVKQSRLS